MKVSGFLIILVSLFFLASRSESSKNDERKCYSGDLQPCKTCEQVKNAMEGQSPDNGEYIHGAQWNGLFAAYFHDCFELGEGLLKKGANPDWGGTYGSMVISLSNKWPHTKKVINEKWIALLMKYKISAKHKVPLEDKLPADLLKEYSDEVDYPDLYKKL
jgi:hypothetical protein